MKNVVFYYYYPAAILSYYYRMVEHKRFRAVRILNAGLMTKKIFIALLIKEFLNSK